MTQEEAREILNLYFNSTSFINLPIYDVVIKFYSSDELESYSFRELIKIAYNLKEDDNKES